MRCFEPLGLGALLYCELVTHSTGLLHQGRLVARPAPQLQEVFGLLSELSGEAPRNVIKLNLGFFYRLTSFVL